MTDVAQRVADLSAAMDRLEAEVAKRVSGRQHLLRDILVALLCRGHLLLEGVPGLGKTLLVTTLGKALDLSVHRVQFTPDLMPADILGTNVLIQDLQGKQAVRFQKGPVFAQFLLADEINRATPKTQSALLEAMQEGQVTIGGEEYRLERPFIVMATQNPIEMEGTYPLPEAQMDRFFFKLAVDFPDDETLFDIVKMTTEPPVGAVDRVLTAAEIVAFQDLIPEVPAPASVLRYAVRLTTETHPRRSAVDTVRRYVRYGAGPRGAQSLVLAAKAFAVLDGRPNASIEDVKRAALPALRHRLILSFHGEAEGVSTDSILLEVVEKTKPE